jgi:hypothetical protein
MFNSPNRSFIAAVDLPINRRVKLTTAIGGEAAVTLAGATEDYIGVTETPQVANKAVSVRFKNSGGTVRMTAAGASIRIAELVRESRKRRAKTGRSET